MSTPSEPMSVLPNIFYVAVAELPTNFERIDGWVDGVLREHPHMLGLRGVIDCTQLISRVPPSVEYLTRLAQALRPLMDAARGTKCALVVPSDPLLWRARIFESLTSASRVHFRAFQDTQVAFSWLAHDDETPEDNE